MRELWLTFRLSPTNLCWVGRHQDNALWACHVCICSLSLSLSLSLLFCYISYMQRNIKEKCACALVLFPVGNPITIISWTIERDLYGLWRISVFPLFYSSTLCLLISFTNLCSLSPKTKLVRQMHVKSEFNGITNQVCFNN